LTSNVEAAELDLVLASKLAESSRFLITVTTSPSTSKRSGLASSYVLLEGGKYITP
jgi:hypothetical protein